MASRMARRTCKLLVRAFDWGAPLLRKLRASEASFFFCHVQAAPVRGFNGAILTFFTFSSLLYFVSPFYYCIFWHTVPRVP